MGEPAKPRPRALMKRKFAPTLSTLATPDHHRGEITFWLCWYFWTHRYMAQNQVPGMSHRTNSAAWAQSPAAGRR